MYKEFAYIYDKLTFDIDYEKYSKIIKEQLLKLKISPRSILELGIGSGNMTKYFYDESINYTGIDLSNEMLSICSNKFRNIRLINQNLINLNVKEDFDFVFSTLDTINYILDESSLQELFVKIKNICNGVFIFDVNTPYKLIEVMGNNHFVYEYDDIFYTWVNQYYEDENIVDFYIDFFLRQDNNLYKRLKENQTEKVYNLDSLKFMLYNSGFNDVNIIDFDDGKSLKDNTNRALFICY